MCQPKLVDPNFERSDLRNVPISKDQYMEDNLQSCHPGMGAMTSESLEKGFKENVRKTGIPEKELFYHKRHK